MGRDVIQCTQEASELAITMLTMLSGLYVPRRYGKKDLFGENLYLPISPADFATVGGTHSFEPVALVVAFQTSTNPN